MAHILHFRGEGQKLLLGVEEYVILVNEEDVLERDVDGYTSPGFWLHKDIKVDADFNELPCRVILMEKFQRK